MGLRYEDLPESLRRAVDAQEKREQPAKTTEAKKGKAYAKDTGLPIRCVDCGERFTWTSQSSTPRSVEKHQASTGHRRYEAILVDDEGEDGGQRP